MSVGQRGPVAARELRTVLVLPGRPASLRLGRQAVLAWLTVVPTRYDVDTTLLLVTELLAAAMRYTTGALELSVCEQAGTLRVEVKDDTPADTPASSSGEAGDDQRRLQLIDALSDDWGIDIVVSEGRTRTRVAWFECSAAASPPPRRRR